MYLARNNRTLDMTMTIKAKSRSVNESQEDYENKVSDAESVKLIKDRQKILRDVFGKSITVTLTDNLYRRVLNEDNIWIPDIPPTKTIELTSHIRVSGGMEKWSLFDNVEEKAPNVFTYHPKRMRFSGFGKTYSWDDEVLYYLVYLSGKCELYPELGNLQHSTKDKFLKISNSKRKASEYVVKNKDLIQMRAYILSDNTDTKKLRRLAALRYMPNVMDKDGVQYIITINEIRQWLDNHIQRSEKDLREFVHDVGMDNPQLEELRVMIAKAIQKKLIDRINIGEKSGWSYTSTSGMSGMICNLPISATMSIESARDILETYLLTHIDSVGKEFIELIGKIE
jgi:hypothetical protein